MSSTCLWAPPVYELHLSISTTCLLAPPVVYKHHLSTSATFGLSQRWRLSTGSTVSYVILSRILIIYLLYMYRSELMLAEFIYLLYMYRSELMLTEFKRDSARKEVDRLQDQVNAKRSELDIFADTEDTTDGNTSTDHSKIRDLKLSRTEVSLISYKSLHYYHGKNMLLLIWCNVYLIM